MRLRRIVGPLVALALLAGCASQDASGIAAHAPGHPLSDVERCLGVPTRKDTVGGVEPNMAGTTVLEWDFSETSTAASSVLELGDAAGYELGDAVDGRALPEFEPAMPRRRRRQ